MKQLKNIQRFTNWIAIAGVACCALAIAGCSRSELGGGEGTVSLAFLQNDEVTVKGADTRTDVGYTLDIVDQKGDTVAHYNDHRNVMGIKLNAGVYTIHAEDNSKWPEDSKFGVPRFGGVQSVTVEAGKNNPVLMTCKLINVKAQVTAFSQDVQTNFTNYSLVIKPTEDYAGRDTLTFTQAEVDATPQQTGWINQTRKGKFVLIFRAFNKQKPDKCLTYMRTIADVLPADFYRFKVEMNSVGNSSDGGALFRLSVKTDLAEYEFPLYVKDQTKPVPVVSREDGGSIREPLTTNVVTRDGSPVLNITAEAGIRRIRIRHENPNVLLPRGLPATITLGGIGDDDSDLAADEATRAAVSRLVTWSEGDVVGRLAFRLDFSGLMNTATLTPGGELLPEGNYEVEVEVYDYDNQLVSQTVTLSVARDFSTGTVLKDQLINGFPGIGAKYAYVSAKWMGAAQPEGLGFEYRVLGEGDDAWRTVPAAPADIDAVKKSFWALLNGLTPKTLYEFRPVGKDLVPGSAVVFATDALVEVPNLDFEGGYTKNTGSGLGGASDVWMVNIPGKPEYWGTGNAGTKNGKALKVNVTSQESSIVYSGKALKLESRLGSTLIGNVFAAGNLFSGYFEELNGMPSTDHGTQKGYVHFGRPMTTCPLMLCGWYRYTSTPIDDATKGVTIPEEARGKPDQCQIYISLENWGTATSRPSGYKNPSLDDPTVIGYGEMHTEGEQNMSAYEYFSIPITYKKGATKPTHVVIVATSSRWGADFYGGSGSVLYIDDFELVWDPTQVPTN